MDGEPAVHALAHVRIVLRVGDLLYRADVGLELGPASDFVGILRLSVRLVPEIHRVCEDFPRFFGLIVEFSALLEVLLIEYFYIFLV